MAVGVDKRQSGETVLACPRCARVTAAGGVPFASVGRKVVRRVRPPRGYTANVGLSFRNRVAKWGSLGRERQRDEETVRVFVTLTDKMAHFVVAAAVGKVFALRFDEIQNIILKNMTIKPLADRVLVKPAPAEEKTIGGIIIPDTAQEKPSRGTVVAVGQGTKDETMVLKAGDNVLYGKYAGTEVEVDGEKMLIMRQSDVFAVVE